MMKKIKILSIMAGLLIFAACSTAPAGKTAAVAADGSMVKVHYTLTVNKQVIDSSIGKDPLAFTVGKGQVIKGFNDAVIGMKAGEKKSFTVSPADGYGEINPNAFQEIKKETLKIKIDIKPGMTLLFPGKNGKQIKGRVKEIKDDSIVIDFNPPLAGRILNFDIEVVDIK